MHIRAVDEISIYLKVISCFLIAKLKLKYFSIFEYTFPLEYLCDH